MVLSRPRTSARGCRMTASPVSHWAAAAPVAASSPTTPPSQRTFRIGRLPPTTVETASYPEVHRPPTARAISGAETGKAGRGGFAGVAARGVGYTRGGGSHKSRRAAAGAARAAGADPDGRVNSPDRNAPNGR